MTDTVNMPELIAQAVQERCRRSPPIWTSREIETIEAIRRGIRALPVAGQPGDMFKLLERYFPISGAMLETLHVSDPTNFTCVMHQIPDTFINVRASLINFDIAIDASLATPPGFAFNDVDVIPERTLKELPIHQALYPHYGFLSCSGLKLASDPGARDQRHVSLWFLHGERGLMWTESHMLQMLHEDIRRAVERMRLPLLPHESVRFQVLREMHVGYVLLRRDWTVLEVNCRAFTIADGYSDRFMSHSSTSSLVKLIDWLKRVAPPGVYSMHPIERADGQARLEVRLHYLDKAQHALPEDTILVEAREIPLDRPAPIGPVHAKLRDLPARQREIAVLLATTDMAVKNIADKLCISQRTAEKHIARIYKTFNVHSRPELIQRLAAR